MAAEGSAGAGPNRHVFKRLEYPTGSQASALLESNFLSPLEESQESQNAPANWHKCGSDVDDVSGNGECQNEADPVPPSLQSFTAPFLRRPRVESPEDFSVSFQYGKPPSTQVSSIHPNPQAPLNALDPRTISKNEIAGDPPCGPDRLLIVDSTGHLEGIPEVVKPSIEADLSPVSEECEHVAVSNNSSIKKGSGRPEDTQPGERHHNIAQGNSSPRRPIQSTSRYVPGSTPIKKPTQPAEVHIARPGKSKLPKPFVDIQRRALIQSSTKNSASESAHILRAQNKKGLPLNQHQRVSAEDTVETQDESRPESKGRQEQLPDSSTVRQSSRSMKAGSPGRNSRKHRHKAMEMARPVTQDTNKSHEVPLRPFSVSSNVSRRRDPLPNRRENPCRASEGRYSSPSMGASDSINFDFAQAYNNMVLFNDRKNRHWRAKKQALEKQIGERDARIKHYIAIIQQKDESIKEFESTKEEQQQAIHQAQEATLAESERVKELKIRMKEYRRRLNAAINEQQELFKHMRARYKEVVSQTEEEGRNYQQSLEQALSVTEGTRSNIQQRMDEVKTAFYDDMKQLQQDIGAYKAQLAEREREVVQEKERVSELRQELLKSQDLNRDVIQSLSASNSKLIEQGRQATTQVQNMERCMNQQDEKIQNMLDMLKDKQETAPTIPELIEVLKDHQSETITAALAEFQECAISEQQASAKAVDDLKADVAAIHELYNGLNHQLQLQSQKVESEFQEKLSRAETEHQALLQEAGRLREELNRAHEESKMQVQQCEGLHRELTTLRTTAKGMAKYKGQAEILEKEKQGFRDSIGQKEACIQALEEKLEETRHTLRTQDDQLEHHKKQLAVERESHSKAISINEEQREKAVKQVMIDVSTKIQAKYKGIEKQLQDAVRERDRVQEELKQAQLNAEKALQESAEVSAQEMCQKLVETEKMVEKLSTDLHATEQSRDHLQNELEANCRANTEVSVLIEAVEKLSEDLQRTNDSGNQLQGYFDQWKTLQETYQWHQSENETMLRDVMTPGNGAGARSNSSDHTSPKAEGEPQILHDGNRRVIIQSPVSSDGVGEAMDAMTVVQEQFNRRRAATPKSILKAFSAEDILLDQQKLTGLQVNTLQSTTPSKRRRVNRPAKLGPVSHSVYNRPVLGSLADTENRRKRDRISTSQALVPAEMSSIPEKRKIYDGKVKREASAEGSTRETKEGNGTGKRTKLSRSMSPYFHDNVSKEPEIEPVQQSQLQLRPPRGEPLERRLRSVVTYGGTCAAETRSTESMPAIRFEHSASTLLENPPGSADNLIPLRLK